MRSEKLGTKSEWTSIPFYSSNRWICLHQNKIKLVIILPKLKIDDHKILNDTNIELQDAISTRIFLKNREIMTEIVFMNKKMRTLTFSATKIKN